MIVTADTEFVDSENLPEEYFDSEDKFLNLIHVIVALTVTVIAIVNFFPQSAIRADSFAFSDILILPIIIPIVICCFNNSGIGFGVAAGTGKRL